MGLIGFTVFKDKILSGEKRQTIRKPRKKPPKVGETLYLYWKLRTKKCEFLKKVACSEVITRKWGDMKNDVELARSDGFEGLDDFRRWFERYKPTDETEFMIIRWGSEKTLTIRMKGRLKEINSYCSAIGELANRYDLEVEFS